MSSKFSPNSDKPFTGVLNCQDQNNVKIDHPRNGGRCRRMTVLFAKAARLDVRSRSYFKIEEIDRKFELFKQRADGTGSWCLSRRLVAIRLVSNWFTGESELQ